MFFLLYLNLSLHLWQLAVNVYWVISGLVSLILPQILLVFSFSYHISSVFQCDAVTLLPSTHSRLKILGTRIDVHPNKVIRTTATKTKFDVVISLKIVTSGWNIHGQSVGYEWIDRGGKKAKQQICGLSKNDCQWSLSINRCHEWEKQRWLKSKSVKISISISIPFTRSVRKHKKQQESRFSPLS